MPVRYKWAGSVLELSHNQRENPLPLFFGMLWLHDLKRISEKGVMGPPEMLWCSKSPGTDGESLKGVGGGVPVTVTNWHPVCGNLGSAEARFPALAEKAECTQKNWAMWVMIIRECEVILCLEGRDSVLLGYPEESMCRIQGKFRTEEIQVPHTLSASVRTYTSSTEIAHCLLEPTSLISS